MLAKIKQIEKFYKFAGKYLHFARKLLKYFADISF